MAGRCIIIGGGVAGLMTARLLDIEGIPVTVLERGRTGREASWAAGGILAPMYPWQYPKAITLLYQWSAKRYPHLANELAEESGIDPEWIQSGMLIFDTEEKHQAIEWSKRFKVAMEILPGETIHNGEPFMTDLGEEALWFPDMAQIRPPRLMKALRKSLQRRGVRILEGIEVHTIRIENERVTGVETGRDYYEAETVVIAGGAWSGRFLESVGLKTSVEPVRGQMILYKAKPGWLSRMVQYQRHYLIPRRDGRILAGSTIEYAGFDKKTTKEGLQGLHQSALAMMPKLQECRIEHRWAGLRPGKKDGIPIVGAHPAIEGLYIHTGHFRNGVILSPASAALLINVMKNETPILDHKPYMPR